ncbi:MAG: hypothetical protein OXG15_13515 [Gammaproteobacteria bacterium]|nr:hypothetical protein [Gammaproteobacteria bacterium]
MPLDVRSAAADVLQAGGEAPPKLVVDRFIDTSLDRAYAVQQELTALRLDRGETQIGYKVGCTSQSIQAQIGIHEPIFGRLFAQDRFMSPHSINRAEFDGLAVEGELAVELDRDPRDLSTSQTDIDQAILHIFPVIELHHFGIPTDALKAPVLVANNAMHAGFVDNRTVQTISTTNSPNLSIQFDGKKVASLPFNDLESTIFDSLAWLRNELMSRDDTPRLRPPVTVLCGSVAPLFKITKPTEIEVLYSDHQYVRCAVN